MESGSASAVTGMSLSDREWMCRQNISNFRAQLGRERSAARRVTLEKLLVEEEDRLKAVQHAAAKRPPASGPNTFPRFGDPA